MSPRSGHRRLAELRASTPSSTYDPRRIRRDSQRHQLPRFSTTPSSRVSTLYKQIVALETKKIGAALIAETSGGICSATSSTGPNPGAPHLLLARRHAQRGDDHGLPLGGLERLPARRRLQNLPPGRGRAPGIPAQGPTATASLCGPRAAPRPAASTPSANFGEQTLDRGAGLPQGFGPGRPAWHPQPLAEMVRNLPAPAPRRLRPGAAGLCRGRKPQGRQPAGAGSPHQGHPGQPLPGNRSHPCRPGSPFSSAITIYFPADPAWLKTRLAAPPRPAGNETLARWNARRSRAVAGTGDRAARGALRPPLPPLPGCQLRRFRRPERFTTDDLSPAGIVALARRIVSGEPLRPSAARPERTRAWRRGRFGPRRVTPPS